MKIAAQQNWRDMCRNLSHARALGAVGSRLKSDKKTKVASLRKLFLNVSQTCECAALAKDFLICFSVINVKCLQLFLIFLNGSSTSSSSSSSSNSSVLAVVVLVVVVVVVLKAVTIVVAVVALM
uniref:Uncharacterized protein n=1 Tax=Glossina austeni TaxID=7395 RepID=A0A1A9V0V4_GLOAU